MINAGKRLDRLEPNHALLLYHFMIVAIIWKDKGICYPSHPQTGCGNVLRNQADVQ